MYGLMIKYFKDKEEINLDDVSLEQFNNIADKDAKCYWNTTNFKKYLKK